MKKIILSLLVLFFSGLIYLFTLSPSISWIDSGELSVVCYTLGIAHPTGYPLYTLIGRVFSLIPIGTLIFRFNLLSLLFISFSNLILFLLLLNIFELLFQEVKSNLRYYLSLIPALIFSFTPTLWSQATSNEVYALNFILTSLLLYLLILQVNLRAKDKLIKSEKLSYLFFFLYGLSFGNHLSTLLLLPGFFFLLFIIYQRALLQAKRVLLYLFLFILGISIYIYLPIRSSSDPLMNWGDPSTLSSFLRHLTGWQYRVWMFAQSGEALWKNLENYLRLFYAQFPFYLLPWILLGFVILLKKNLKLFLSLFLIFIFTVFYGINYEIHDIDPYFLPSFLVAIIWLGCGIAFIIEFLYREGKKLSTIKLASIIIFAILSFLNLFFNYSKQDQSKNYFVYDYAENILRSAKKNPIILTKIWDHYSPWLYLRFIENKRPDVRFLDTELLRRSWYLNYLEDNYPELYSRSEKEIELFRKQVYLFENNLPYDQNVIEKSYVDMVQSFLLKNYPQKPLYCDLLIDQKFLVSFLRFPEGVIYRLDKELGYYPFPFPELRLRGILEEKAHKDERTLLNLQHYFVMIKDRISYIYRLYKELGYYPFPFPELQLRGILEEKAHKDERTLLNLQYYSVMIKDRISYLHYFKQDSLARDLGIKYQRILRQDYK